MNFVDFKKSLNDTLSPVYVFYGEDAFLIETCIKNLKSACEITQPNMNITIFKEDFDFKNLMLSLETFPFIDKTRLVIVYNCKMTEDEKSKLISYAQNPNTFVCLALVFDGESKLPENDKIVAVNCNKLDANMLKRKVLADLKPKGVLISDDALKLLFSYCDLNLTQINSELEKLISYAGDSKIINEDMIRELCVKDVSYSIYELTDALGNKRTEQSINILNGLLKDTDVNMVIGLLYGHFRRLLISSIIPNNIDNQKIANSLQVKPYAISVAKNQSKNFGAKKLFELCEKLQEIDLRIKNNFSDPQNEIYSFVFLALGD